MNDLVCFLRWDICSLEKQSVSVHQPICCTVARSVAPCSGLLVFNLSQEQGWGLTGRHENPIVFSLDLKMPSL